MKTAGNIILKLLALLLITGAALKGHQLLTEPVANTDIWSNHTFLVLTVEFEIALAIWLFSGLFKKLAWLITLSCFSLFSCITLYKGLSGYASCGCFGSLHVNPWLTLFAIDLPAVILLIIFHPRHHFESRSIGKESMLDIRNWLFDIGCSIPRLAITIIFSLIILATTAYALTTNKPAKVTSAYEILEPETWIGKQLPILDEIDIGNTLRKGNWLVLFYHHDCPDCIAVIEKLNQTQYDIRNTNYEIALIEVPPYGDPIDICNIYGRLPETKEWFITTPAVVLIENGKVKQFWQENLPDFKAIFTNSLLLPKGGDSNGYINVKKNGKRC